MTLSWLLNIAAVVFAFGFVIFWHELGHFLAARWAGVRVEQFAVGMGQAIFSWRKGIGFRLGNTQKEFDKRVMSEFARRRADPAFGELREPSLREKYDIAKDIGLGETDYRLNWIPIGGYVKPTGQDDLRPAQEVNADDPHAFGAKPVGKRMVIIAAGVVMNVILAFGLYVWLFLHGFNAPPAVIGQVLPGSPAQEAGLLVGDRVLTINDEPQQDFTKFTMNVAMLRDGEKAKFIVERDGVVLNPILIQPVKIAANHNMPAIGAASSAVLTGAAEKDRIGKMESAELAALPPEANIVAINGTPVGPKDYGKLDAAIQKSGGEPVKLTIRHKDGKEVPFEFIPSGIFRKFGSEPGSAGATVGFVGLQPRVTIEAVQTDSPAAKAGVKAGDVVQQIAVVGTGEVLSPPSLDSFLTWVADSGQAGKKVRLTVIRDGVPQPPIELSAESVGRGKKTIGVYPDFEMTSSVAGDVLDNSPASRAGILPGESVTAIAGKKVSSWFGVLEALRQQQPGEVSLTIAGERGSREVAMKLSESDVKELNQFRLHHNLPLAQLIEVRKTKNPLTAMAWGVEETKWSIFNVYITLNRLFEGSVPLSNLSGPIGIFNAGSNAADKGLDWLIWFSALISANLAVVNFLPIPIVDGGLFIFLLMEKLTGKPPSARLQTAAQLFGLVLLGSLFLFVTYHDVVRLAG